MSRINYIRKTRLDRGRTQTALAEAVGISRQHLVEIEAGRANPSVEIGLLIAAVLFATVEELWPIDEERAG